MPVVDLADETFVLAPPAVLAPLVHDPGLWRAWWPQLRLTVARDRGERGLCWTVSGALQGTAEIWLEPCRGGTVLHVYLRADPARAERRRRRLDHRYTVALKCQVWALKDWVEGGRPPGGPG
jgi:hypothetical protein